MNLFYNTRYSAYAQDDWQISPRFTLSYGVRYMLQTTWKERDLAQAGFDFASGKAGDPAVFSAAPGAAAAVQRLPDWAG